MIVCVGLAEPNAHPKRYASSWDSSQNEAYLFYGCPLSNPQKITCIIFENLFGSYFLPHQSHSYGYAPSSGENLTSKMSFKSDATYYFHITKQSLGVFYSSVKWVL